MTDQPYYRQRAQEFFDRTVGVDVSRVRDRFLTDLPTGGLILDAGCGSGRDSRAFREAGFQVEAFDASPELARLATQYTGYEVAVKRFSDVIERDRYDGIWASASLLHVPAHELPKVLQSLTRALKPGGHFYMSFKWGLGERQDGERRFTDHTTESLIAVLQEQVPELELLSIFRQPSLARPDGLPWWVNAFTRRRTTPQQ